MTVPNEALRVSQWHVWIHHNHVSGDRVMPHRPSSSVSNFCAGRAPDSIKLAIRHRACFILHACHRIHSWRSVSSFRLAVTATVRSITIPRSMYQSEYNSRGDDTYIYIVSYCIFRRYYAGRVSCPDSEALATKPLRSVIIRSFKLA